MVGYGVGYIVEFGYKIGIRSLFKRALDCGGRNGSKIDRKDEPACALAAQMTLNCIMFELIRLLRQLRLQLEAN